MLFLFVMCLTQGFSVRKIGVSAQKDTKSSDADFYSLSSVRISPSDEPIGTSQNPILVENDYEVTYGSNFKIVRMK